MNLKTDQCTNSGSCQSWYRLIITRITFNIHFHRWKLWKSLDSFLPTHDVVLFVRLCLFLCLFLCQPILTPDIRLCLRQFVMWQNWYDNSFEFECLTKSNKIISQLLRLLSNAYLVKSKMIKSQCDCFFQFYICAFYVAKMVSVSFANEQEYKIVLVWIFFMFACPYESYIAPKINKFQIPRISKLMQ